jgi:hypothetical protein
MKQRALTSGARLLAPAPWLASPFSPHSIWMPQAHCRSDSTTVAKEKRKVKEVA